MSFIDKILGDPNKKILKKIQPIIDEINGFEEKFQKLSDEELKGMTADFRKRLGVDEEKLLKNRERLFDWDEGAKHEMKKNLDNILPEAFAVVREVARRVIGLRHYDVQLIGGIVLHRGQIAEMKTGEGKTLVATLPLYLNALSGRSVQLITVNDYLAREGAGQMAPIYNFLGLSVGVLIHDSALIYDPSFVDESQYSETLKHFRKINRREAYDCDILYGTNNEFGFDYLRDNMVPSLERMVQRCFYYSIVDEIDSILIDEARTPLIISAPAQKSTEKYYQFADLVKRLKESSSKEAGDGDYNVDEKMRSATLTEAGINKMEEWLGVGNIYTERGLREVHHIEQALKAHALFKRDRDYVVQNNEVIIVDEFTGRLMEGRRYSEGLHQAIEAKEGVTIQRESQTMATITFQNYFRMYEKLAGMTGTAVTEAEEFAKIYQLEVVIIPTNKDVLRIDHNDFIYKNEKGKYLAVIEDIKERTAKGQPCLVGTISIEKNEVLVDLMQKEGLNPQMLNAKNHEKEARIIAQAGEPGTVTIATNMAGRGVDIVLGGVKPADKNSQEYKDWEEKNKKVIEVGGLHVIGTERHESRRIDNQLRGRSGRQGDLGSSRFYVSMDDDLMRIFGGDRMKSVMTTLKVPDDMPIENKLISKSIESAQRKVENNNFDMRKHLVEYDDVINKHREAIYAERKNILKIYDNLKNKKEIEGSIGLSDLILEKIENEIEQVVIFHTATENIREWNLSEIVETVSTIFPLNKNLQNELMEKTKTTHSEKLDKVKLRTEIIEQLVELSKKVYFEIKTKADELNFDWLDIEKSVMIRSIDNLWVEHLDTMSSMRQGIGLRGYGQRDPLIEYKKESYSLYNQLNSSIAKEIVYSIYKLGMTHDQIGNIMAPGILDLASQFIAPAKEAVSRESSIVANMEREGNVGSRDVVKGKMKNDDGDKVGRNDLCPCGSGKKFKKCCGK